MANELWSAFSVDEVPLCHVELSVVQRNATGSPYVPFLKYARFFFQSSILAREVFPVIFICPLLEKPDGAFSRLLLFIPSRDIAEGEFLSPLLLVSPSDAVIPRTFRSVGMLILS